ncbi:hypothetical protein BKA56DRAFT_733254 [Ilyonectria sp. MPI-CAGE-AT-0026]|nr:hypothetical protein BKA56DRAFT_733254 [Ilyonectria sp. MPI-CAGE-AT-0026]
MDPITLVGLAASILTLVEVGFKLGKTAREIYNSKDGNIEENKLRETLGEATQAVSKGLKPLDNGNDAAQQYLYKVAKESEDQATSMLNLLERIRPKKQSWHAPFSGAAKVLWRKRDIEEIEQRLGECRTQLTLNLVHLLRKESTDFFDRLLSSTKEDADKLDQVLDNIKYLRERLPIQEMTEQLKRLVHIDAEILLQSQKDKILSSLQFEDRGKRFDQIHQPHVDTFRWIFEEDNTASTANSDDSLTEMEMEEKLEMQRRSREKFLSWLSSRSGIFHIHGKLGSGKSTLMKFLASHERTKTEAKKWAGDKKVVISSFFFWKSGQDLQRSIRGLCRSLLYDILKQRQDLIPATMPDIWAEARQTTLHTLTKIEISADSIQESLERVLKDKRLYEKNCFCFFIDGLDEHVTTSEDHRDLVKLLRGWSTHSDGNLKLCVASREEVDFMNAFSESPSFQLQELTWFDMRDFVWSRLEDLQNDELRLQFANRIPEKADGIFFWVCLVVNVIRGKMGYTSDEDLEKHLENLQPGLMELFKQIIDSLDEGNQRKTCRLVALLRAAKAEKLDVSLLAFSFLDEYDKDKEFSTREDFVPAKKDEAQVHKRLRDACGGLVEYHPGHSVQIWGYLDYAHRSVPDMFQKAVASLMRESLTGFNDIDALSHLLFAAVQFIGKDAAYARGLCAGIASMRLTNKVEEAPYQFLERMSSWVGGLDISNPGPNQSIAVLDGPDSGFITGDTTPAHHGDRVVYWIYSTLYLAAFLNADAYVKWKIQNDPTAIDNPFKRALVASVVLSWTNPDSELWTWEYFFESGCFTKDSPVNVISILPSDVNSVEGDELTVWQRFQVDEFAKSFDNRGSRIGNRFSQFAERALESGLDASFSVVISLRDSDSFWEVRFKNARLRMSYPSSPHGVDESPIMKKLRRGSSGEDKWRFRGWREEVYSFRDWIEAADWENKDRLLELLDSRGEEAHSTTRRASIRDIEQSQEDQNEYDASDLLPGDNETLVEEENSEESTPEGTKLLETANVVPMIIIGIAAFFVVSSVWVKMK